MEARVRRTIATASLQAAAASDASATVQGGGRRKPAKGRGNLVIGAVSIAVLTIILVVGLPMLAATRSSVSEPAMTESAALRVGTMVLPSDGENCRHVAFENTGTAMWEMGKGRCAGPSPQDPREAVRQRYSGGRLDAIRKSFSER